MCEKQRTKRLFDRDAYIRSFTAVVTDLREAEGTICICLDRTAFYPEGGGQAGDRGWIRITGSAAEEIDSNIRRIEVIDTREEDGRIWHYLALPGDEKYSIQPGRAGSLEKGCSIFGELDWEHRFELMRGHSGEHIVSGIIHSMFGCDNVGFHMGSDCITIDFNTVIPAGRLREIEDKANRYIAEDHKPEIRELTPEDASKIEYRSKKEIEGLVRIVTFPGADVCACCGTHVSGTAQIGLVKLISCIKFRSGVRIEMVAGSRAISLLSDIWKQNSLISVLLCVPPADTAQAVARLKEAETELKIRNAGLEKQLMEDFAERTANESGVLVFCHDGDMQKTGRLAALIMERQNSLCAVFSGNDETGYVYCIGKADGNIRELTGKMNERLNGRGGGKPGFVQGRVTVCADEIDTFFKQEGLSLARAVFQ